MIGRAFAWVRDNWYTGVLPWTATVVAIFGLIHEDAFKLALGALMLAWAGWMRENEHGR